MEIGYINKRMMEGFVMTSESVESEDKSEDGVFGLVRWSVHTRDSLAHGHEQRCCGNRCYGNVLLAVCLVFCMQVLPTYCDWRILTLSLSLYIYIERESPIEEGKHQSNIFFIFLSFLTRLSSSHFLYIHNLCIPYWSLLIIMYSIT